MLTSHLSYHPRIGYTYLPGFRGRVPHQSGGYLIRVNSTGFRSEREFVSSRPPGLKRMLVFGDSQTAGLGVDNRQRFADILETLVPDLEVFNYGLDNTGTDQQYLAYREFGDVAHDLLLIGLFVEDLARVNSPALPFKDARGRDVLYAKPFYTVAGADLVLNNVPVPKRPISRDAQAAPAPSASLVPKAQRAYRMMVPSPIRRALKSGGVTDLMQKVGRFQRVPGYGSPLSPAWQLFARVLKMWIAHSQVPVLLCPIPMWTFVTGSSDPSAYRARFRELALETGCLLHDPLDDLLACGLDDRLSFFFAGDKHLSSRGHRAIAHSLAPIVRRALGAD